MESLTREERELIEDLHALRRVNYPRYVQLLEAFDGVIKCEAQHQPGQPSSPQPEKVIQFNPAARQRSR